jgi:hypothetical protein
MSVYVKVSAYSFVVFEGIFQFSTLTPQGRYILSCSSELGFWFFAPSARFRKGGATQLYFQIVEDNNYVSALF